MKTKTINKNKYFELYINEKRGSTDLSIYEAGWEKCHGKQDFSSAGRDYYLLHYIVKGKGMYIVDNNVFPLHEKMFFLIHPNQAHRYYADSENPYEYHWIAFHGLEAKKMINEALLDKQYVFQINKDEELLKLFEEIRTIDKNTYSTQYMLLSYFYKLLALIIDERKIDESSIEPTSKEFIGSVIKYIQQHYNENINVSSIASYFHINRSHLYRVFSKRMGLSIEKYLITTRLANSLLLLKNKNLTIKQVANLVGFKDYNNFLKLFKNEYKITPKQYKRDPFETEHE